MMIFIEVQKHLDLIFSMDTYTIKLGLEIFLNNRELVNSANFYFRGGLFHYNNTVKSFNILQCIMYSSRFTPIEFSRYHSLVFNELSYE